MPYNKGNHPELQEGEVFLSNDNLESYKGLVWKIKRKGKVPYDTSDSVIHGADEYFPVFVQRFELEEAGVDINKLFE